MIVEHGGEYDFYPTAKTDIVLAESLSNSKKNSYKDGWMKGCFILRTRWLLDCVSNLQLQDPYLKTRYSISLNTAHLENRFCDNIYAKIVEKRHELASDADRPTNSNQDPNENPKLTINQDEILSKLPKSFTDYNIDKNTNLVQAYFEKSRLSHIANWRTEFIQYVANQNTKKQILPPAEWVIHIDMDCFFVAIARKLNPSLLNKPVAVCYSKSKTTNWGQGTFKTNSYSEIASCSYEARKFGIRAGELMMSALRKCPELLSVGYNFDETKKVAMVLYDEAILEFGADVVQPVSCDEMFIDISNYVKDIQKGSERMEESENLGESKNRPFEILKTRLENLRKRIFEISNCSASIGCGRSTTIARLATKMCKPDGLLFVENSEGFMEIQKFSDLPGIGPSTMTKLLLQNPEFTKDSTCADVVSKSGCLEKVWLVG
jgi:DNA repair protein REV1